MSVYSQPLWTDEERVLQYHISLTFTYPVRLYSIKCHLSICSFLLSLQQTYPMYERARLTFRKVKMGSSSAPLTSVFRKRVMLGSKPPPGRTYLIPLRISLAVAPGSCYNVLLKNSTEQREWEKTKSKSQNKSFLKTMIAARWYYFTQSFSTFIL